MKQSEFRKDIVSGEWVLIAGALKNKPNFFPKNSKKTKKGAKKNCPFENLSPEFATVIPNKYPALSPHKICPDAMLDGPYEKMKGTGFHELVITRDHDRPLGYMKSEEILLVIKAYIARYLALKDEPCIEYILIFHNNGPTAGATVPHPHSQILALPIIPLDVYRSLMGSERYFKKHRRCAHCTVLKKEIADKERMVYMNEHFIAICPFASHVSFEIRIYPRAHRSNFERMSEEEQQSLADMMRVVFTKIKNGMNDTDYNFFIHTASAKAGTTNHYHWHLEILPRTNIWGGLELGSGTEIVKMPPEEAAKILRQAKS